MASVPNGRKPGKDASTEISRGKRLNLIGIIFGLSAVLLAVILLSLSVGAIHISVRSIVAAILKREELGSTGIGMRVAVPHTKHPSVDRLIATIALSQAGVDFASLDGEDVNILFLLVSPPDRPGDHLRGLENISRHLRNQNFCKFLRQSTSQDAIWDLLREADNNEL